MRDALGMKINDVCFFFVKICCADKQALFRAVLPPLCRTPSWASSSLRAANSPTICAQAASCRQQTCAKFSIVAVSLDGDTQLNCSDRQTFFLFRLWRRGFFSAVCRVYTKRNDRACCARACGRLQRVRNLRLQRQSPRHCASLRRNSHGLLERHRNARRPHVSDCDRVFDGKRAARLGDGFSARLAYSFYGRHILRVLCVRRASGATSKLRSV